MELLYILLVLLAATRICGELAVRLGQPALVGELISGVLIGVVVQSYPETFPNLVGLSDNETFKGVTDLGVFFLMLFAGLEMRPGDLTKGSTTSISVAVGGMAIPLALGFGFAWLYLPESPYRLAQSLFLGTALAVTAVPVAIKILIDMNQLESRVGQTIVSAAIVDDVLSLILLSVLTALLRTGEMLSLTSFAILVGQIVLFFVLTAAIGVYLLPKLEPLVKRLMGSEIEFSLLILVALAFAVLAEFLNMHFIIGAFVAGLFFNVRTLPEETYDKVKSNVSALTKGLLAPIFFASIGLHLDLGALTVMPVFVCVLVGIAIGGKIIGAALPALALRMSPRNSLAVGVAMSARGAVELIIADIALQAGLFSQPDPTPPVVAQLFSAVVIMAIATTLLTPIGLRLILPHRQASESEDDPAPA